MDNTSDRALLEKLLAKREAIAGELMKLDYAIEQIQAALGEPGQESAAKNLPPITMDVRGHEVMRQPSQLAIRPDQFFRMSQTEASEAYLKMVGHAVNVDQILEAIRKGGVKVGGVDPKTTLYKALVRGTRKFVLVSPYTFGLREFYPNRTKIDKKPEARKRRKRRKVKSRVKKIQKKSEEQREAKKEGQS